nr:MAG TPA: hypothetical protein [Caudoviricetes sp.]
MKGRGDKISVSCLSQDRGPLKRAFSQNAKGVYFLKK